MSCIIQVGDRTFETVSIQTPSGSVIKVWPEAVALKVKCRIEEEFNARVRSWATSEERRRKLAKAWAWSEDLL